MMEKKSFARFSFLLLSLSACAAPSKTATTPMPAESGGTSPTKVDAVTLATLSADHAVDGAIIRVNIHPNPAIDIHKIKVTFEGAEFPIFEGKSTTEFEALVAVPFNTKPRDTQVVISFPDLDSDKTRSDSVVLPLRVEDGHYKTDSPQVDNKHVNPNKMALHRIEKEQAEVGKLYRVTTAKRYWKGPFQLPIQSEMTSPYGNKRLFNGKMKSFHQGMDLRAKIGTAIRAPEAGKVVMAKDLFFTGNTVIMDHGYGLFTIYAHMSKLEVKAGDEVPKDFVLGLSGMTGRASGPHLHWGAVIQKNKVNPLDLTRVLD